MENTILNTDQVAIDRLSEVFAKQKTAFLKNPYPSAAERIELMKRVKPMLIKNRQKILNALDTDFGGHSHTQGDLLEIVGMFDRAEYNITKVKKWMRPSSRAVNPVTMGSSKAYLKYHPKGVIGNMVSWNFPFDIAIGPMLDQLAAGNRVIIKPSDLAPASGKVLEEMIAETFDEDQVAVVNGGLEFAKYFPTLKWNHLVYTGSGAIGRKVMEAAAKNLVPVTLELGGKSPVIIDNDSVTEAVAAEVAGIKMVKRGQMCVTGDYCFVPESQVDTFVDSLKKAVETIYSDDNGAPSACGIITARHEKRLQSLVENASAGGAKIIKIGENMRTENRAMPFHIIVNPSDDFAVSQEEIFGPILPIIPYKTIEEIISKINTGDSPLGLYIYSQSQKNIDLITENTRSGGISINVIALHAAQPSLPFGGIGESGMGVHHGEEGFKEFSNPRGYFVRGKGGTLDLITPPYGQGTKDLIEKVAYAPIGQQLKFALKQLPKNLWARIFG